MMAHIRSEELCERCAYGIRKCMEKWDEEGRQCEGCGMSRVQEGKFIKDGKTMKVRLARRICICDEIAIGTPCEFFKEVETI